MFARHLQILAAAPLLAACCSQGPNEPALPSTGRAGIREILAGYGESGRFSGTALIYEDGEVLLMEAYGLADRDRKIPNTVGTRFSTCSVSKLFTFAAVLRESDRGALDLDDTLDAYIPDYPQGDRIKVSHLLFHMSGIVDLTNDLPWEPEAALEPIAIEELIESFKHHPLEFEPGSRVEYSNSGYVLLAHIVEQTSGLSFKTYVEQNLFDPAGMVHSTVGGDPTTAELAVGYGSYEDGRPYPEIDTSHFVGSGNVFSTVEDLLKWHTTRSHGDALHGCPHAAAFGRGYGYRGAFVPIPSMDIVIILLSNDIDAPLEEMVGRLTTALLEGRGFELPPEDLVAFTGDYNARAFDLIEHHAGIWLEGDRLLMTIETTALPEARTSELHPLTPDRFVSRHEGSFEGILITFHRDDTGRVTHMTSDLHGCVFDAVRIE